MFLVGWFHCVENLFINRHFCLITVTMYENMPIIQSEEVGWANEKLLIIPNCLCAQLLQIEHDFSFHFWLYWKLLGIYFTKSFSAFLLAFAFDFYGMKVEFTCKLVSFSKHASKYHTNKPCCEIDRKSLKRKIVIWE